MPRPSEIPVTSICHYLTSTDGQWPQPAWDISKIVKALKEKDFKGYVELQLKSGPKRYTSDDRTALKRVICVYLGATIQELFSDQHLAIVPVPNSAMALGTGNDFPIARTATIVAQNTNGLAHYCDALRWKAPKQQAHTSSGYRYPEQHEDNLVVTVVPQRPVLLIDDVLTSGSQMTAAARVLADAGCNVIGGLVFGRSTKDIHDKMYEQVTKPLPLNSNPFDLSDLDF